MWHKNVSTIPVDIGGQMIPPSGWADLTDHARQVGEHVAAGRLVASDVAPEDYVTEPQGVPETAARGVSDGPPKAKATNGKDAA